MQTESSKSWPMFSIVKWKTVVSGFIS